MRMALPPINPTTPTGLRNLIIFREINKSNEPDDSGGGDGGGCMSLVAFALIGSAFAALFRS